MRNYRGSIEDVLMSGEHDSGDEVTVSYDELFDLVQQGRIAMQMLLGERELPDAGRTASIERISNRPLHPNLGGKSPYSEFLPL